MTGRWREVTKANPCPACGKSDWCAWTPDGDVLKCERSTNAPTGMVLVKAADGGGLFKATETVDADNTPRSGPPRGVSSTSTALIPPKTYPTARDAVAELEHRHGKRSALWTYHDAQGDPVGVIVRWDRPDGGKDIRPVSRTGSGWIIGGMPTPRPLYRLPELGDAQRVYIAEGEPAADSLRSLGLIATTSPHGSKAADKADWSPLTGKECVISPDADDAGRCYADDVTGLLAKLTPAAVVKVVELPDLPSGGDAVQYVEARRAAGLNDDVIRAELERLADAADPIELEPRDVPEVVLPGGHVRVTDTALQLGQLLGATGRHFNRGGAVAVVSYDEDGTPVLNMLKPAATPAAFEGVAQLYKLDKKGNRIPTVCSEQAAKVIMHSEPFLDALPPIYVVTPCPVLIERDGKLVRIAGYDRESGTLAGGQPVPEMPLDEVRELLDELLRDFRFATASDRSRALAALITPSLALGGLLSGRAPVDLGEADASQAGKGYRNRITAAIYSNNVTTVTQRKGGVGSMEESFNAALIHGKVFISFDNIRGKLDSPAVESFLTEDRYSARMPYSPPVEINPLRTIVMMTSNSAEITADLANRSSCVRLLKQPEDYEFRRYEEGDLLDHVRANPERRLGAVFAVVRAWHAAGKPRSTERRHDFRIWSQSMDWIVQNLLGAAPLIEGHAEAKRRMTDPALTWLRRVALVVFRAARTGEHLRTYQLLDIIENEPDIDIPGIDQDGGLGNDQVRDKVLRAMGWRLKKCFSGDDAVEIDDIVVERHEIYDDVGRPRYEYTFVKPDSPHSPASAPMASRMFPAVSRISRGDPEPEIPVHGQQNKSFVTPAGIAGDAGNAGDAGDYSDNDDWGEI